MIDKWFRQDIEAPFKEHKRVVVTDKGGNGRFLVNMLHDCIVIEAGNELEELHARYDAEKNYAGKSVVFMQLWGKIGYAIFWNTQRPVVLYHLTTYLSISRIRYGSTSTKILRLMVPN